jgi:hypothetical protein
MNNDIPDARVSDDEDSASDMYGDECAAAESHEEIVNETTSPMKTRTRSKSWKANLAEPLMCSDPEDEQPPPQPRKSNSASRAPLRAGGHVKYFRRNSNQFQSIASKKLAARKSPAGGRGRK